MALKLLLKKTMARRLLLFSTICSLFLLGYLLPKWMGPKNCINSSLVEEITLLPSKQKIQSCSLQQASFAEAPPDWFQKLDILNRIESVNYISSYWGQPREKMSLIIKSGLKPEIHFRDQVIILNQASLSQGAILEKSLLQYWLASGDFMSAEITANVVWSIHEGKKEFHPKPWLQDYSSLNRYCQRGLNILQHAEFCSIQNEMRDSLIEADSDISPTLWSLNKSISEILIQGFYNLPLKDKEKFLQNIVFMNGSEDFEQLLEASLDANDFADLDSSFELIVHYMLAPLDIDVNYFQKPLLMHSSTFSKQKYDYIILADDVSPDFRSNYFNDSKNIVLEQGSEKSLYPSDTGLYISRSQFFNKMDIESVTLIGCQLPRPKRLLEFESYAEEVLFVKVCDDVGQIQEMIEMGARKFVRLDHNIEFVEFNIAALKFAAQKRGELQSSAKLKSWQKWLQWQDYVFESDSKAYRPRAVYDAVGLFRSADL